MREALAVRLELGESRVQVKFKLTNTSNQTNYRSGSRIAALNGANAKTREKHRVDHRRVHIC